MCNPDQPYDAWALLRLLLNHIQFSCDDTPGGPEELSDFEYDDWFNHVSYVARSLGPQILLGNG